VGAQVAECVNALGRGDWSGRGHRGCELDQWGESVCRYTGYSPVCRCFLGVKKTLDYYKCG
jgi:hypothetical protein